MALAPPFRESARGRTSAQIDAALFPLLREAGSLLLKALESGELPGYSAFVAAWRDGIAQERELATIPPHKRLNESARGLASLDAYARYFALFVDQVIGRIDEGPVDGFTQINTLHMNEGQQRALYVRFAHGYAIACERVAARCVALPPQSVSAKALGLVATLRDASRKVNLSNGLELDGYESFETEHERFFVRQTWGGLLDAVLRADPKVLDSDRRGSAVYPSPRMELLASLHAIGAFADAVGDVVGAEAFRASLRIALAQLQYAISNPTDEERDRFARGSPEKVNNLRGVARDRPIPEQCIDDLERLAAALEPPLSAESSAEESDLTPTEQMVWDALAGEILTAPAMSRKTGLAIQSVRDAVVTIRLKRGQDCIETQRGGGYWRPDAPPPPGQIGKPQKRIRTVNTRPRHREP